MQQYVTFKQFNDRCNVVDAHFERIDRRFDELVEIIKHGFGMLNDRIDRVEKTGNGTNQLLHQHLRQSDERFRKLEAKHA